jgi:hypothetical protein
MHCKISKINKKSGVMPPNLSIKSSVENDQLQKTWVDRSFEE